MLLAGDNDLRAGHAVRPTIIEGIGATPSVSGIPSTVIRNDVESVGFCDGGASEQEAGIVGIGVGEGVVHEWGASALAEHSESNRIGAESSPVEIDRSA